LEGGFFFLKFIMRLNFDNILVSVSSQVGLNRYPAPSKSSAGKLQTNCGF
jgi:hypothetical protein